MKSIHAAPTSIALGLRNLDSDVFKRLCEIAYTKAGITLGAGKEALVTARINRRLRALKLRSGAAYLALLENDQSGEEMVQFLDAISTNYTSFFREPTHFRKLAEEVKGWLRNGQRRLRLWSAACSSGEEPYTLTICLTEALEGNTVDFRILATDISTRVLSRARQGIYPAQSLVPLEPAQRHKYFERAASEDSEPMYQVRADYRSHVVFKRLNLAQPPFPMPGPLDAVFCRNVMIYFDRLVRQRLIGAIAKLLKPGGFLFVGHSESLAGIESGLHMVQPSIYIKPQ